MKRNEKRVLEEHMKAFHNFFSLFFFIIPREEESWIVEDGFNRALLRADLRSSTIPSSTRILDSCFLLKKTLMKKKNEVLLEALKRENNKNGPPELLSFSLFSLKKTLDRPLVSARRA